MKGVAFKVNYNDGGAGHGLVGYQGVCSDRMILQNVKAAPRVWCSAPTCDCKAYCDNGFAAPRPQGQPCYESSLLISPFRFGPGVYRSGRRVGKPIPVKGIELGDIAFLTTILPDGEQLDRIIFGCYRVGNIVGSGDQEYFIESDETMDIKFPDDVARNLYYWNYQRPNKNGTKEWKSGLFRYLNEEQTSSLFADLLWRLGDDPSRDVLYHALGEEIQPEPNVPGGARGGGESDTHRRLKEHVAKNPQLIDLPKSSKPSIEFVFLSGDRVDIKFDLPDGTAAVVEIETDIPLPGAHQAVKYRSLLEVRRGEKLGSGNVRAILVAHRFDKQIRKLAKRYDIKLFELTV